MRLAYLINQYPTISHTFIRREIHALERKGFHVQRIALRGWSGPLKDPEDVIERSNTRYVLREGLPGLILPTLATALAAPLRFFAALRLALRMGRRAERPTAYHVVYLAEACRVLRWLRKSGAEHLHAHFGTNSAEVAMLARELGGPRYSFTVHGPEEYDKPQSLHLGEKVGRAAFVVAVSSFGRSQLYRWTRHERWGSVHVVRCGLERAFYDAPTPPLPAEPRAVCVGRLCEQKGQLLLIDAAHRLALTGVDFEIVLVGDGEMRHEIEQRIADYGLASRVTITGWVSNARVREAILSSRGLVLPSFAEGLPVVLMEAMALRRPVISTYIAGIPELVTDGEHGWLIPAGDEVALAAALNALFSQPVDRLRTMGIAAHARVADRHCVDNEAAKLGRLLIDSGVENAMKRSGDFARIGNYRSK